MGQAVFDALGAIVLRLGQRVQALGEAAIHVNKGQVFGVERRGAQAAYHFGQQLQGKFGALGNKRQQARPGDNGAGGGLQGDDIGRAGFAVERHFAKIFACAEDAKSDFFVVAVAVVAGFTAGRGFDLPCQHDEHRVAHVALCNNDGAFAVAAYIALGRQFAQQGADGFIGAKRAHRRVRRVVRPGRSGSVHGHYGKLLP